MRFTLFKLILTVQLKGGKKATLAYDCIFIILELGRARIEVDFGKVIVGHCEKRQLTSSKHNVNFRAKRLSLVRV